MPVILRECPTCHKEKPISDFIWRKGHGADNYGRCKTCEGIIWAKSIKNMDGRGRMWLSSKKVAFDTGIEHTITINDIPLPNICKYFGWTLIYKDERTGNRISQNKRQASLDRIDSTKGYTPDNIQVISLMANRMKYNATQEELIRFAKGILKVHG